MGIEGGGRNCEGRESGKKNELQHCREDERVTKWEGLDEKQSIVGSMVFMLMAQG